MRKLLEAEHVKNFFAIIIVLIAITLITPILFGIRPFVVMSGSMSPAVKTGSLAYINTRFDSAEIQVGDIIAYNIDGSIVSHRVVSIQNDKLITKGDANPTADAASKGRGEVMGKLLFSVPYAGYAVYYLQTPLRILRRIIK